MDKVTSDFLSQASQHLFAASPSTSAHLSFNNLELQVNKGRQGDSSVCRSCGSFSVLGRTGGSRMVGAKGGGSGVGRPTTRHTTSSVWISKCTICNRNTRFKSSSIKPPSARKGRHVAESVVEPVASVPTSSDRSNKTSDSHEPKLSSKKRAKARNDRSSLQALLKKSDTTPSTTRLSFGNLMKR
jgi:hypothetical protein